MAQRKVIKISVTPAAKAVIEGISTKHDMKEIGVASRIYEWFATQDDVIQKGILRMLPDGYEADVAKLALERLAAGVPKTKAKG